jgi:hypothetical protein
LSFGLASVSYIALWDGKVGDGPGGTKHMVDEITNLTGKKPRLIDPATL